jgi:hypothetical protein
MTQPMQWDFGLTDKLSGPAQKMDASLADVEARVKSIDTALRSFDKAMGSSGARMKAMGDKRPAWMRDIDDKRDNAARIAAKRRKLASSTSVVVSKEAAYNKVAKTTGVSVAAGAQATDRYAGALSLLGRAAVPVGAAIAAIGTAAAAASIGIAKWQASTAMSAQQSLRSFELLTGGAASGSAAFGMAAKFADRFAMPVEAAAERVRNILGAGFSQTEVSPVFQALMDVDASGGKSDGLLGIMEKIQSAGRATSMDIESMARSAGLSMDEVAKSMGTSRVQLRKMLSGDSGFDPKRGILGVLNALSEKGGGALGSRGLQGVATMQGRMRRLMAAPSRIVTDLFREGRLAGFASLDNAVAGLDKMLEPGTDAARRLEGVFLKVDGAIGEIFSRWSGADGADRLRKDLDKILSVAETLAEVFERFGRGVGMFLNRGDGRMEEKIDNSLLKYTPFGAASKASLWLERKLFGGAGGGEPSADPYPLGEGEYVKSEELVPFAKGGIVRRPTRALIGEAGPEAVIPLRKFGSDPSAALSSMGGARVALTVNVDGAGFAGREAGEALAERLEPLIIDFLEQRLAPAAESA